MSSRKRTLWLTKRQGIDANLGTGVGSSISFSGIINNVASRNARDGILVRAEINGSGTTPIAGNEADRNKEDGIDIESTGYFLSDNSANGNSGAGISAVGNTHDFTNTAHGNATCNTPGCFGP
jgi:hypothetical protein